MNHKFLRISLLSILFTILIVSSVSNIQPVEAYTYTDLNIPDDLGIDEYASHPTYSYDIHQITGKIVYVSASSNDSLRIYILDSTGNLESFQKYDLGITNPTSVSSISVIDTPDNFARVFVAIAMGGVDTGKIHLLYVNINVNTYAITKSSGSVQSVSDGVSECRASTIYRYGEDLYTAFIAGDLTGVAGDAETRLCLAKLDISTNLISVTVSAKQATPNYYSWTYGIQDTQFDGQFLYVVFGRNGYDTVHYGKWDLNAETWIQYANQPTGNNRMIIGINSQFIGGGIVDEWDNGGSNNYTWLYYTWAWTEFLSDVNYVNLVHTKLCFNDTDQNLDTTKLLGLTESVVSITTYIGVGVSGISGGWHINQAYNNFYVIFPDLQSGILSTKIMEWDLTGDWFNLANSAISSSDNFFNPNYSPYYLYNEMVGRNFSLPVQVNVYPVSGRARIIYGLTVFEAIYDITLSWVPNDEPFYSDTLYGFDGITYRNEIGTQTTIFLYKDDILTNSFLSDTNGEFSLTSWMYIGVSNWEFRLYSGGESVYNETFGFLSVYREGAEGEDVEPSLIMPTTVNLLFMGLVPLIMSLVPAVILGQSMGLVGIVIGLGIGIGICSVTGILPSYFLYLDILFIAIIFVYFLRGR